jgi:hypothetical protein
MGRPLQSSDMPQKEEIKSLVSDMANRLSEPLLQKEIKGDWTDKTRLAWLPQQIQPIRNQPRPKDIAHLFGAFVEMMKIRKALR